MTWPRARDAVTMPCPSVGKERATLHVYDRTHGPPVPSIATGSLDNSRILHVIPARPTRTGAVTPVRPASDSSRPRDASSHFHPPRAGRRPALDPRGGPAVRRAGRVPAPDARGLHRAVAGGVPRLLGRGAPVPARHRPGPPELRLRPGPRPPRGREAGGGPAGVHP